MPLRYQREKKWWRYKNQILGLPISKKVKKKKVNWQNNKSNEQHLSNTFWFYFSRYMQRSKYIYSSSGKPITIFIWEIILFLMYCHLLQVSRIASMPNQLRIIVPWILLLIKKQSTGTIRANGICTLPLFHCTWTWPRVGLELLTSILWKLRI